MNSMSESIYNEILKYNMISTNDKVLVGLSGGADSVFLLHMLVSLKAKISFSIGAAHLNHSIRGKEAARDQEFCRKICENLSIPFHTTSIDVPGLSKAKKMSEESVGREERYEYFKKLSTDYGYNKIAVAHNMNDSVETLLINIIRGCSLNGMGGIRPVNGNIIRPVLHIERAQIEKYLHTNNITYCTDSTNSENVYTRNKIRNLVLKHINDINPSAVSTIFSNLETIREDNEFLDLSALETGAIKVIDDKVYVDKNIFNKQHISIKKRIICIAFKTLKGDTRNIEQKHIDILLDNHVSGKSFDMPCSINVKTEFEYLVFSRSKKTSAEKFHYSVDIKKRVSLPNGSECFFDVTDSIDKFEDNTLYVDYHKINADNLILRSKHDGDKFIPQGMKGSKKIKQFFIEQKIPLQIRSEIPILCSDDDIVAVIPYRISDKYKITDNTKEVLRIHMIKENKSK